MDLATSLRPCPVPLLIAHDADPTGRPRELPGQIRVRRGVYVPVAPWRALAPWDRYLTRVHAVAAVRPNSVFCLESAAALCGLPLFGEPRNIHVYDPVAARSTTFGDIAVHTSRTPRIVSRHGDNDVVGVADTVVDLARVLPPAFALATLDAAIGPGSAAHLTLDTIADRLACRADGSRGTRRARWAIDKAEGRAESVGESVSRAVIDWLGYPPPTLQRTFRFEGVEDRVDFFWEEYGVAVESDGYGKYSADAVASVIGEKRREDRLRRHLIGFARWDWTDAMRADPLDRSLAAAGLRPERARQHGMLATLRRNPRSL